MEVKNSVAVRVPVVLLDSSGNPVTGTAFGSVTASVEKSDGSTVALTVTGADWTENTSGGFNGGGKYTLLLPSSALNLNGPLTYAVKVAGARHYFGTLKVVAQEEADSYAAIAAVQTTVNSTATQAGLDSVNSNIAILDARVQQTELAVGSTATQTGLDAVNSNVAILDARIQQVEDVLDDIRSFEAGRWKIFTTGPDANRIVYYKEDGVTVLAKFDLKDIAGSPTYAAAFERLPVP